MVDSSFGKMVAPVADSVSGFSLGKRMVVVVGVLRLGLDSGNLTSAGSRALISLAGRSEEV